MKIVLPLLSFFLFIGLSFAQNPEGFDKMAKDMAGNKAPVITMQEVQNLLKENKKIIFLDTREYEEYKVSHMKDAKFVGYNKINFKKLNEMDKEALIVVYCLVGYRSGKITEKMEELGFTNVKNLYGGLFNWVNNGGQVTNGTGKYTKEIHGFSKKWAKWVNTEKAKVVL